MYSSSLLKASSAIRYWLFKPFFDRRQFPLFQLRAAKVAFYSFENFFLRQITNDF
jgi:hypothetical protein